jgi:ABC-type multidrug transport system fused ATPase/permease subunit
VLPVADAPSVRRYARALLARYPGRLAAVLGLHAFAAASGLAAPWLLGELVQGVHTGISPWTVDRIAIAIAAFVLVQAVVVNVATYASARLGERVLAELREEFVERVLALPLSTVERAGSGDLITRSSRDVAALSNSVRYAVPEILIAAITVLLTMGGLLAVAPVLVLPSLISVPVLVLGTRWYLRRAPAGYLRENAAYTDLMDGLAETVEGARTVEALRTAGRRQARTKIDLRRSYRTERYTLYLRTVWLPVADLAYLLPTVATLLAGGWLYLAGWVTLGQVTAATLYVQQLVDPLDRCLSWLDELQVGGASLARILGVAHVPDDRVPVPEKPVGRQLAACGVRYSYVEGRDVLHGLDLVVRPGERLAVVGPSGAGKSTLGRLLAGVAPPRVGSVAVGGVPLIGLPLPELRGQVALVTQEHHVFAGTLRDNVSLARPDANAVQIRAALRAVDALRWVEALPAGLDTPVGSGGRQLSPAQAQQIALARLVLADPHTLVLDEATSLIDPRAARHLERSLAAVLHGRTVIAIAHRLFSAHDADRVAVVIDGHITELGSHDELVAAGGAYADLWRSWQADLPRQGVQDGEGDHHGKGHAERDDKWARVRGGLVSG